jgi:N-methylhydantoinase A
VIDEVVALFHRRHEELYAYSAPGQEVVIVNARVAVIGKLPELSAEPQRAESRGPVTPTRRRVYLGDWMEVPVYKLDGLPPGLQVKGAAIFESPTTTVLIRQNERASVTQHGWLDIELG